MISERLRLRVQQISNEAEGINSYELVDPRGADLPSFTAGSHIDVHLPGSFVRQYSLCNSPSERNRYVIAVLLEPNGRGGSRSVHENIRAGGLVEVSPPRNNFVLTNSAAHYLFIAGGIGITPIKSMMHRLQDAGASVELHYCTRTLSKTAFSAELASLAAPGCVHLHHDGGDPSRGLDLVTLLGEPRPDVHVYCCGPLGLMTAVKAAAAHWPSENLHFEYFSSREPEATNQIVGEFVVKIGSTGSTISIPKDRSVLEALRSAGITVDSSCEAGVCGTCRTRYLEGEPDHRDSVLTEEERADYLMICVSRSRTPFLVLDL